MGNVERPISDQGRQVEQGILDPRHFYAAYVFDNADSHKHDVITIVEESRRLGYPVRYWWLSEAMDIGSDPDRLIVCVHHPSSNEDAGMDLYDALKEHRVVWDDLDSATVEEYGLFSKPVQGPDGICRPDGTALFPFQPPPTKRQSAGS